MAIILKENLHAFDAGVQCYTCTLEKQPSILKRNISLSLSLNGFSLRFNGFFLFKYLKF